MEDTFSCIHGSLGRRKPASEHLLSEPAIVAGIAKATLPPNPKAKWDEWVGDYALIRDAIAETYPDEFHDFNARMWTPGGFYRGNSARERIWKTKSGKAEFTTPEPPVRDRLRRRARPLPADHDAQQRPVQHDDLRLQRPVARHRGHARRAADQPGGDAARRPQRGPDRCRWSATPGDGVERRVDGLTVTPFKLPDGCLGGYYPELNPLIPLWNHDQQSKTPASKSVPVRIRA